MGDMEQILERAGTWGLGRDAAISAANGSRVTAVRWRHQLPEFSDSVLLHNTLVYMLRDGRSCRHRGGQREDAVRHCGGMGLVPEGSYGAWTFDDPIDVMHVYIPQATLDGLAGSAGLAPVQLDDRLVLDDPVLRTMAHEIAGSMGGEPLDRLYTDMLGCTIATRLIRDHSPARPLRLPSKGGLAPWQVRRAREYLETNLDKDIGLEDLSRLLGLSSFHLCRAFKQSTGLPPHRYLMARRIERAKELLATSGLPLTEIALACGFGSSQHFAAAFRKATGLTPSEYRRQRKS
jgi:AraC family transcriptional regulator